MSTAAAALHYLRYRFQPLHPFEVQAVLQNDCNLRCTYCRCPETKTDVMPTADWLRIVEQFAKLGTYRIKYQGGEPTLRADFAQLCAATRRAGIRAAVVTNGWRIARNPSLLDELDEVVVSVDALTPERHDRYRGAGSHAAAMKAVTAAIERGLKTFVVMVVHRDTIDEVEAMLEHCEAIGAGFHAQPVVFGSIYHNDDASFLALGPEGERALNLRLAEWQRQRRGLLFSAGAYERSAAWPHADHMSRRGAMPSGCMAGRFYVHLEANGDVHPCGLHNATFTPKNAVRDGLEAALHHARHHDCANCCHAYLNERKALFGLSPPALLQLLRR